MLFKGADGDADRVFEGKRQKNGLVMRDGARRKNDTERKKQNEATESEHGEKLFYSLSSSSLIRTALMNRLL